MRSLVNNPKKLYYLHTAQRLLHRPTKRKICKQQLNNNKKKRDMTSISKAFHMHIPNQIFLFIQNNAHFYFSSY